MNGTKDFYPDLLSKDAVPPPDLWSEDFVVRSLRRRLWMAVTTDDSVTALRAYQANFHDFTEWLQQEDDIRRRHVEEQHEKDSKHNKKDKRTFLIKRRSQKENGQDKRRSSNSSRRSRLSWNGSGNGNKESEESLDAALAHTASVEKRKEELMMSFGTESILQIRMDPSERFIADDMLSPYDDYVQPRCVELPNLEQYENEQQAIKDALERQRQSRRRGPRQAFRMVLRRGEANDDEQGSQAVTSQALTEAPSGSSDDNMVQEDIYMTTPLHEAARLGAADFVRFLLANGGDPNIKNGQRRTALHMTAGGLTNEENQLMKVQTGSKVNGEASSVAKKGIENSSTNGMSNSNSPDLVVDNNRIGIGAISLPSTMYELIHKQSASTEDSQSISKDKSSNSQGLMSRLFRNGTRSNDATAASTPLKKSIQSSFSCNDPNRLNTIVTERMDTMLACLSWTNSSTGDGPSLNAVDGVGRTALHYSAEMGRSDICMAILSTFGAMLTVVDDLGTRTPCELAALHGHRDLAAQLEARALLYVDPYGVDEDMMQDLQRVTHTMTPREKLAVPFGWFETMTMTSCGQKRMERIDEAKSKLKSMIAQYTGPQTETVDSLMKNAAQVGLDAAMLPMQVIDVDDSCEVNKDNHDENVKSVMEDGDKIEGEWPAQQQPGDEVREFFAAMKEGHIEKFLAFHGWDVSEAVAVFRKDPLVAFKNASISIPTDQDTTPCKTDDRMCPICYENDIDPERWVQLHDCNHGFCKDCLIDYLGDCAKSKSPIHTISCPQHDCISLFPTDQAESLLEAAPDTLFRIEEATVENFVMTARDTKFCPHPGCNGIVLRTPTAFSKKGIDVTWIGFTGATCLTTKGSPSSNPESLTYEGCQDDDYRSCIIQPDHAHRFCFACGESVHWPLTCERLVEWKEKLSKEIGDVNENDENTNYNELAQKLWIKANTRPCPKCSVAIEKNEGCNHMTCTNPSCLHEFCWVCRKSWHLHGSTTGGFYRCNIWQEDNRSSSDNNQVSESSDNDGSYGTAIYSAREAVKTRREMDRFLHHYTRWEAHEASAALERKMADSVCARLEPVVEAAKDFHGSPNFDFGGLGLSFIHDAFTELLECRSVLRHSYAYSFFRYQSMLGQTRRSSCYYHNSYNKEKKQFERYQSELEILTEQMSDIVARLHLRATQLQIQLLTARTADMRKEFTFLMFRILHAEKKGERKLKKQSMISSENTTPSTSTRESSSAATLSELLMQQLYRGTLHSVAHGQHAQQPRYMNRMDRMENDLTNAMDVFASNLDNHHQVDTYEDDDNDTSVQMWACSICTFVNNDGEHCAMCGSRRTL